MKILATTLKDAYLLKPNVHFDGRGYFFESYSKKDLLPFVKGEFVQDNQSLSTKKGVLRGLHLQRGVHSQGKLVRVVEGAVDDVIVDVRKGSPTYLRWEKFRLSAENFRMLYVPKGFLHGFVTLTDEVIFAYKVDEYYDRDSEQGVYYADPLFGIDWGVDEPILSDKDRANPLYFDSGIDFTYGGER